MTVGLWLVEYAVRVLGEVTPEIAKTLTAGVVLDDGMAKFDDIKEGGGTGVNKWYHVTLKEGRKREVRRLFDSQELKVSRLIRTRYGSVILPKQLRTGRFIELDAKEIGKLCDLVGLRHQKNAGLTTHAKEKQARITKKPLKSRAVTRKKAAEKPNDSAQKAVIDFKKAKFSKFSSKKERD